MSFSYEELYQIHPGFPFDIWSYANTTRNVRYASAHNKLALTNGPSNGNLRFVHHKKKILIKSHAPSMCLALWRFLFHYELTIFWLFGNVGGYIYFGHHICSLSLFGFHFECVACNKRVYCPRNWQLQSSSFEMHHESRICCISFWSVFKS